jgi:hypothetical protein
MPQKGRRFLGSRLTTHFQASGDAAAADNRTGAPSQSRPSAADEMNDEIPF